MISVRRAARHKDWLSTAVVCGGVVVAVAAGWILVTGSVLPALAVIGLVAGVTLTQRPEWGLYLCYPLLLLVPYSALRYQIPLFHSPLQVVATLTLGVAVLQRLNSHTPLPRSRLFVPIALCALLLGAYALARHGPAATERFYRFLEDLWPVVLIPMLVTTPRQARIVLISLLGSLVLLALLWLPGLLVLSSGSSSAVRTAAAGSIAEPTLAVSLLGAGASLSYLSLVAMALVAPVFLSFTLDHGRRRITGGAGFVFLSVTILLSTYALAVVALAISVAAFLALRLVTAWQLGERRLRTALAGIPILVPVAVLGLALPPTQEVLRRIAHPALDAAGSVRLFALTQGVHAFLARPFTGWGAFDQFTMTPAGWALGGHSSYIVMAYEFGLLFLVPFIWMNWRLGRSYVSLIRSSRRPFEVGIASALLASFLTAVVISFVEPVFGEVLQDAVIWTLAGLAIVWTDWKRRDSHAALL